MRLSKLFVVDRVWLAIPQLAEWQRIGNPALLRLDPMFDPLRNDPRFQKLCEEKPKTLDK